MSARLGLTRLIALSLVAGGLAVQAPSLSAQQPAPMTTAATPSAEELEALAKLVPKLILEESVANPDDAAKYPEVKAGMDAFVKSDLEKCRKAFATAKEKQPFLPPVEILTARMFILAKNPQFARGELEMCVLKNPTDPEAYLYFAEAALVERRVTDAAALATMAGLHLKAFQDEAKAKDDMKTRASSISKRYWNVMAAVSEARDQWPKAVEQLTGVLAYDAKNASVHQRLGRAYFMQDDIAKATEALKNAVANDKNSTSHQILLAQLYQMKNKKDEATKYVEDALKDVSDKDRAVRNHIVAAQYFVGQNDMKRAGEVAEKAVLTDPKSDDAALVRGIVARMAGDFTTAENKLDALNKKSPANFAVANNLALVLCELNDPDKRRRAIQLAELTLSANQKNQQVVVEAAATLGWTLYKNGDKDKAIQVLDQVVKSNQLSADSAYYVSQVLFDLKKYDDAQKVISAAIESNPVFFNRANAVKLKGEIDKLPASVKPATPPAAPSK
jgi:tetratricopeptide (TPR) repeat protein